MKNPLIAVVFVLLAVSCGGGGSDTQTPPPVPGPTVAEQLAADLQGLSLDVFYFESFKALYSRSPETVVWRALTDIFPLDVVGLDDLSDGYQRDTYAMFQVVLDALHTYDRSLLSASEQLNYDVYDWYLQDKVDELEFIYYDYRATYALFGTQRDTEIFFTDIHPLLSRQDAEDYITRLHALEVKFGQLSDYLLLQRGAGIVEPALTMQIAISQVAQIAQTAVDYHPYFTSFRDKIGLIDGLSESDRQDLLDRALAAVLNRVIPAYELLLQTLQTLLNNAPPSIGVGQFARGNDYYTYILRHHSTTNLTAAEIHQLGLSELTRVHAEMRLIFDQLGYPQDETLQQLFARAATGGGIIPAADVLATFEALITSTEAALDQAFDIFPSADVIVVPVQYGGYYIGPSLDGTRPGAFYAGTTLDQPWLEMPTLTYHESVPGHHTQIGIAMDQDVSPFRKIAEFTGFVEGWALYAERLAYELGWYGDDVYGNLGRLQYEALRAVRLVVDTGIHNLGWSFDQAVQFNDDNVGVPTGASQGAAARYSVIPGQATAYMIGMLQILQVRQRAMDELGAQFDLKDFHRALLSNGAVPLALLDSVVDNYIAQEMAAP